VQLDTGEWVKGFICEPAALAGATEITSLGGWRNYLAAPALDLRSDGRALA
jgi:allophanate hydrolase